MGAACCTNDPSQDNINTESKNKSASSTDSNGEKQETNGYQQVTKQPVPEQSKSTLDIPGNDNTEEPSLDIPSTLSDVEDAPDIIPPSGDEYEEEPEKYVESQQSEETVSNETKSVNDMEDKGENEDALEIETKPVELEEAEQEQPPQPKHKQVQILENEELKQLSIQLVTGEKNEFIKFLKKILKSKLNAKIWSKCDPNGTDKIETEKFMYFWTLPVTLFKVAVYQRKHGNGKKPKLDQKELKREFTHLATWIIRRYGTKQPDGGAVFVLSKDNFAANIVEYVEQYAQVKGELYEEY